MSAADSSQRAPEERRSILEQLRDPVLSQAASKNPSEMTPVERLSAMRMIDRTEQRIGYVATGLALFFGLLAIVLTPQHSTLTHAKEKGKCPSGYSLLHGTCTAHVSHSLPLEIAITVVFTAAILITTRLARRTPLSFAALLTGVAYASFGIEIGAPFLIYGAWLLLRARRIQKFGVANAKEVAAVAGTQHRSKKSKQSTQPSTGPKTPEASKRYTPKKPVKKKPAPKE